jgi:hypothetical protein
MGVHPGSSAQGVMVPPQAAERVAVKKSSAVMAPMEDRCSM